MPCARHNSFTARSDASEKTTPVGLFGETVRIAFVRGVIAASKAFNRRR